MKIQKIINGENLKSLADVIVDMDTVGHSRSYNYAKVVFCKTDLLGILFSELAEHNVDITLISHLSDYPITESLFNQRPKCVKRWFAQNADYQHVDLIPIPIGLENHCGPSKGSSIDKSFIENELDTLMDYTKSDTIYVNFANTHSDRQNKRTALENNPRSEFAEQKPYREYFKDLAKRKYIASPRGNGIDCHRTWEAILVGSTPIVDRHFSYDIWNIPAIQIDNWSNLDDLKVPQNTSCEVLYMDYWRKKIRGWN